MKNLEIRKLQIKIATYQIAGNAQRRQDLLDIAAEAQKELSRLWSKPEDTREEWEKMFDDLEIVEPIPEEERNHVNYLDNFLADR